MSDYFDFDKKFFHYKYFQGEQSNAVIVLIHGLGEHIGRYQDWSQKFNKYNYAVCGFDLAGHGKSDGKRGYFKSLESVYDTIDYFIEKVRKDFPNRPIILYGHSMGGNIATNYVIERQPNIKCFIISSPWIKLAVKPNVIKHWLAKTMYQIYPKFSDHSGLKPKFISRIDSEVQRYIDDKLIHYRITPGLFLPIYIAGLSLKKKADRIKIPTLIFHGSSDSLTSHKASEEFASMNDKIEFQSYEGGYHELHNDLCREELHGNILDWMSINVIMR